MTHMIALAAGFLLDLLFGDPRWLYHPICLIGNGIAVLEKGIRNIFPKDQKGEFYGGLLEVLLICGLSFGIPMGIVSLLYKLHLAIGFLAETFWCYQLLAAKSLKTESMKVYQSLKEGTLEDAQYAVSMIVGRDTKALTETGVIKAAVETVAENTSDGVVAPAFYMALGGIPLMFLYKGINTMDSMLGYKNEKYLYFGRCAAKLDDVANYLPARIAGWMMVAAAYLLEIMEGIKERNRGAVSENETKRYNRFSGGQSLKIYLRDRRNHASPNSAQTEAAMAGALQVQLAGDACYFGKLYKKPFIGDLLRPIEREDIRRSNQLMYGTAVLSVLLFVAVGCAVYLLFL